MMPLPTASVLANRVLEPLSHPWAVLGGGLLGGGALFPGAVGDGARLAWRLLCLLLAL
ncbi:MAG: hypothetical protein PHQ91_03880 [Thermoanaerobaculaceae bacterium]|nr:hypothetical protein [Thermoanaerobaculaceae bacterium]